jgi:quinol monooxygenase YgiN
LGLPFGKVFYVKNIIYKIARHIILKQTKAYKSAPMIMGDNNKYSIEIIRYTIPADKHQDFEKAYAKAATYLKASPFCLAYEVIHGEDEPDQYVVRIHWTSTDEHLNGFRKSSEFQSFFHLVKPFFANIQEMKHYHPPFISWIKQ